MSVGRSGKEAVLGWVESYETTKNSAPRVSLYSLLDEVGEELAPGAEPRRAFQKALEEWRLNQAASEGGMPDQRLSLALVVRWEQLLSASPEDAIEAFRSMPLAGRSQIEAMFGAVGERYLKEVGWRKAVENLRGSGNRLETHMLRLAMADIGQRSDLGEVREFQNFVDDSGRASDYLAYLGEQWDLEKREELLPLLEGTSAADYVKRILRRIEGQDGIDWMRELVLERKVPPESEALIVNASLGLSANRGLGLDERFEFTKELGGELPENVVGVKTGMVTMGVRQFLESEDDWAYQFRHGQVSMDDIFEAAKGDVQEVADHEKEFRSQLFRHFAEEDLDRAMELFEGSSPEGQNWQKIYAARWWFSGVNPNEYLGLMEAIDFEWGQDDIQESLWAGWHGKSSYNIDRYGENYLRWIEQMPAGVHKGRALQTYINQGEKEFPELGTRARGILTEMQQEIRKGGEE